ncbi:NAD-dependent epimerase/dehydratase family protein [Flavisolibacter ginsenosidimutans]|uniref:NAD-dependent epimerase/dehydratase family protein n=1 Tax=Flavisolibacter ginsenosidimutans TaxID=661481 RepID=A0A5B8UIN8_9BACT|nr:NAD-dependent epimerase/dehydratase family protein [Flavisolibacter ginsenosidimutans]QEC56524.1 NAD-dependent epimerase/dehydratase family protein [Flavisolibacter ginsenosidimutans]
MVNLRNKKVLVTGGAGFVGSNLVRTLVQKHGATVTVLDDLFTGDERNLAGVKYQFIHGSVENKSLVNDCVKGKDFVFHLASRNIIISNYDPCGDLNVNVIGSYNIFEACLEHNVKRVVYSSTSSVYGNPQILPVQEDDPKSFLNFYSASKYSAEVYAKTFYAVFNLPVTVLRYSNIYGDYQTPSNPYCGVIGKFMAAALAGEPLKVHGDGLQTRDYTYINDAVNATIAAAFHPKAIGEDYNIGTGVQTSVLEVAQAVIKLAGSRSVIQHVENRDIDNIRNRCICVAKAMEQFQYRPVFSIEEGLKATLQWAMQLTKTSTPPVLSNSLTA